MSSRDRVFSSDTRRKIANRVNALALRNAASVASLILTIEVMTAERAPEV